MAVPEGFESMIGNLVDLFVLVLAGVVAFLAYRVGRSASREVRDSGVFAAKLRQNTIDNSKTQQEAIVEAVRGDDPAGDLAKLGNERRS